MQNEHLLSAAAEQEDSLLSLAQFSAFCIAQYGGTHFRLTKPFNPILGETYEFCTSTWQFVAEQVSHHPPVSAAYVNHPKYNLWMNTSMKTKFWGTCLEFRPLGDIKFRCKQTGHEFVCTRPNSLLEGRLATSLISDSYSEFI